ncbi:VWA domain-containing protein [Arthrobacter crystallopoietes]|uniref:vWA domain-containing protein n=1 Tax=Crystallibacter crystallopoietes TaxID=37928 RepID=UPI003D236705
MAETALRRLEPAELAAALVTALHRAGAGGSPERAVWLAQALRLVPPATRASLYWTCRTVLVSGKDQLPLFDAVFAAVFGEYDDDAELMGARGEKNAPPPEHRPGSRRTPAGEGTAATAQPGPAAPPAPAPPAAGGGDGPDREAILLTASAEERLHTTSFADLTDNEQAQLRLLIRRLRLATPVRQARRTRASARAKGQLDLRRTARAARRTGSDPVRLVFARRRRQPRKLVMLCDVSGSMEAFTRAYLTVLQAAVASAKAEAFVFATRLTRLTRQLALHDPDQALARAAAGAEDWSGGTRLAEGLRSFIDAYGRRGAARGAVVVIFSDGWARDDPEDVAAQMARLRRLAFRIIWVNPRKAAPGYQPLAGGMAAALPFCDAFVSGHSYDALAELASAIRSAPAGKPATATRRIL